MPPATIMRKPPSVLAVERDRFLGSILDATIRNDDHFGIKTCLRKKLGAIAILSTMMRCHQNGDVAHRSSEIGALK